MKKITTFFAFIFSLILYAQAPDGFNYQTTVRNSTGNLVVNQNVYFKFNIISNLPTNLPIYSETHYVPTDEFGQVSLVIGQGTPIIGLFSDIDWFTGTYYLNIELNTGSGYVTMGTTQFVSVPYALYASSAGSPQSTPLTLSDVLTEGNNANNKITDLANPTELHDAATKGYLDTNLQTQLTSLQSQINDFELLEDAVLPSVVIGLKTWTTLNLDVETYRDGTIIPQITSNTEWANATTGAWCYYANNTANGVIYGKIYNWYAVMGIHNEASRSNPSLRKNIAPQGWHVPSLSEGWELIKFLGGLEVAGGKMKATGTSLWSSPNSFATNSSGFTALPGGIRNSNGIYSEINSRASFWTASSTFGNFMHIFTISAFGGDISYFSTNKAGYYIRLVKD